MSRPLPNERENGRNADAVDGREMNESNGEGWTLCRFSAVGIQGEQEEK